MSEGATRVPGLVSIVTPCLNAAAFLEVTIASVMAQSYAKIEYIVVDGGSVDQSVPIATTFGDRVTVIALPNSTQAQATNAGFRSSRGEFFTFLGADDVLAPTAIAEMVAGLDAAPSAPYVFADAEFIGVDNELLARYPTRDFSVAALAESCYICQPATLLRAAIFERVKGLDERYHAAFDYDLWIRLASSYPAPVRLERSLVGARMHRETKTYLSRQANFREICSIVRGHFRYVPFSWVHAYAGIALTNGDTFFDPPRGSFARTLLTLVLGLAYNYRRPIRFMREFSHEVLRLRREKRAGRR